MACAAVASAPAPLDWAALTRDMQKKQSFEQAAKQACAALAGLAEGPQAALGDPAFRHLLSRARTLLRSRYSSRPFWVAGRQLFSSARQAAIASGDSDFAAQLAEYIAECNAFLGDDAEGSSSSAGGATSGPPGPAGSAARSSSGFLFEGQLSAEDQVPPRPPGLLDLLSGALGQQLAAAAAQAQAQQRGGGEGRQQDEQQAGGEQQQQQQGGQQQQGAQQQQPPLQPSPEVLEAIERELDAIAVRIMEETGQAAAAQRAAPPASKKVVASLPVERLTQERLQQLGGPGVRCPVCMDDLAEGDEVQVMPCSQGHVFHPPCLRPWLEAHNSCPTCRHELPTDDQQYERRKQREAEEAEERQGAANAVSHNEFLYI